MSGVRSALTASVSAQQRNGPCWPLVGSGRGEGARQEVRGRDHPISNSHLTAQSVRNADPPISRKGANVKGTLGAEDNHTRKAQLLEKDQGYDKYEGTTPG